MGHRSNRYKITEHQYHEMVVTQGNRCAICRKYEQSKTRAGVTKPLAIDHDHTTGRVRGLLCDHCNRGLGNFMDNIDIMYNAIDYINRGK